MAAAIIIPIVLYIFGIGIYLMSWFMIVDCSLNRRWSDGFNRKGIAKMILWPLTLIAYLCAGFYIVYKFLRYDAFDGFKEFLNSDLKELMSK